MYPDWPKSAADLVPLPQCDGPKLMPFDFHGPQKIEFLEYVNEGSHSKVFKVRILKRVYALKVFSFNTEWMVDLHCKGDPEAERAFYPYADRFNSECRAFARLKEAGHEQLSIRCFGYVLLDKEHEAVLESRFTFERGPDIPYDFDREVLHDEDQMRPPLRCIVKEFGSPEEYTARSAKRIVADIKKMHQLGIIRVDPGERQVINGKHADFSTAITIPHFLTTPSLNPYITLEGIRAMEFNAFQHTLWDYVEFDFDLRECSAYKPGGRMTFALPGLGEMVTDQVLRSKPCREKVWTFVDPRLFETRIPGGNTRGGVAGLAAGRNKSQRTGANNCHRSRMVTPKRRWRIDRHPARWYLESEKPARKLARSIVGGFRCPSVSWRYKNGFVFPMRERWSIGEVVLPETVFDSRN